MRFPRVAVVLSVAAVVAVTGCGGRQAASAPRFVSVIVTDQEDGTVEKTTFAPDTRRVYVRFNLADVSAGTVVKSVWIAEKTDSDPETRLDDATLTVGGSVNSGRFWFSRPPLGWAARAYRVELYLGDRLAHTARFQVQAAAPPAGQPSASSPLAADAPIGTITFAHGESGGEPERPAERFAAGVGRVYGFFSFTGLAADDVIRGVWTKEGQQVFEKQFPLSEVFSGQIPERGTIWLWIHWNNGAPAGSYRLDVSVNGTLRRSGTFVVEP